MAVVGYARVSTADQDLKIQHSALRSAGCQKTFSEKKVVLANKGDLSWMLV